MVQNARLFESDFPPPYVLYFTMRQLGQVIFNPPSVKGWDGGKAWISTSTLLARYNLAGLLVENNTQQYLAGIQRAMRDGEMESMKDASAAARPIAAAPLDLTRLASPALRGNPPKLIDALSLRLFQAVPAD